MKTAILAFLLLCSQAFATSLCVRVVESKRQPDGSIVQAAGYGTVVVLDHNEKDSTRWIAITARHVLAGATPNNTSVAINGGWVPVSSIHHLDGNDDVAFLMFRHERQFRVPNIAPEDPGRGQRVKWTGYSGGKKFEKFEATVNSVDTTVAFAAGETRPKQGQSGGGVYDDQGRICGVVSGYANDTGELIYTPMCHIQRRCHRQWGFGIGIGVGPVRPPVVVVPAPVIVAPSKPPLEVEPEVAPPPPTDEKPKAITSEIQKQLDELRELIKAIPGCNCINKDKSKPSASVGPPCRCKGDCNGCKDGCKCDLSKVAADIAKAKVPIRLQILKENGDIIDEETFPHGTPLKIKLVPKKKTDG